MVYERIRRLPTLVRTLCFLGGGWIVGSGARYLAGDINDEPRDWDVVIPPEMWSEVTHIVPHGSRSNTFGGFKVDGVDFWPEDLGHYMKSCHSHLGPIVAVDVRSQRVARCEFPGDWGGVT